MVLINVGILNLELGSLIYVCFLFFLDTHSFYDFIKPIKWPLRASKSV